MPALRAVTNPSLDTVARELLLLTQVPPLDGVTFVVVPIHMEVGPPTFGFPGMAFMTTWLDNEDIQPLSLVILNV